MRGLLLGLASTLVLGLDGCGGVPPTPTLTRAMVTPATVAPGEQIHIAYTLDYSGSWKDLERVEVIGLPQNTLDAGTTALLPLPPSSEAVVQVPVTVRKPAADGVFRLNLRVSYRGGQTTTVAVGSIQILDVPTKFEVAEFDPGSRQQSQCVGGQLAREFKYAVADDNGADDLVAPRLTVVGREGAGALPPDALGTVTPANPNIIVAQPAPPVTPKSTPDLLLARADSSPPVFQPWILLNAPRDSNSVREVVVTPILVNCVGAGATPWTLTLSGTNRAAYNQQEIAVAGKPVEYVAVR